ncbi:MAG: hypothetical protein ACXWC9_07510 [Pseudobdellovibrionaceae bacterium]
MATQYPNNQSSQNVADKPGMGSQTGSQQQKDISSQNQPGRTSTSTGSTENLSDRPASGSTSSQNKF